jgi:hypothetical protein
VVEDLRKQHLEGANPGAQQVGGFPMFHMMPTGSIGPSIGGSKIAPMNRSQPDLQYNKATRQRLLDAQKSGRAHDNVAARARLAQKDTEKRR